MLFVKSNFVSQNVVNGGFRLRIDLWIHIFRGNGYIVMGDYLVMKVFVSHATRASLKGKNLLLMGANSFLPG